MRRTGGALAAALLFCMCSGCGTIFNVTGHEPWLIGPPPERPIEPFGGVDNDVRWISRGFPESAPLARVAGAIDMPFSFVGDLITLPWTAYQYFIVRRKDPEPSSLP
jgi:uncharacterized protein YceK